MLSVTVQQTTASSVDWDDTFQIKSNQFIYQPAQVTKKQYKTIWEYTGQMAYTGFKKPLTCGQ